MELYDDRDEEGKRMYDDLERDSLEIMDGWRQRYRAIKKTKEENPNDLNIKFDIADLKRDIQYYSITCQMVHCASVIHYSIVDIENMSNIESDELEFANRVGIAAWEMLYYIRKELE